MSDAGSPRGSPRGDKATSQLAQLITAPNPVFSSSLLNTLKSFWLENKLCDLQLFVRKANESGSQTTLKSLVGSPGDTPSPLGDSNGASSCQNDATDVSSSGTWAEFNVHGVIMAACSPVIDQLLRARALSGDTSPKLYLDYPMLESRTFDRLLFYMYSGKLEINNLNDILATLVAARTLQLNAAMNLCAGLLIKFMTNDNVVDFLTLAQSYELEDLTNVAFRCIWEHFVEVAITPNWLSLDPNSVERVIAESSLQCNSEADVVIAVSRWVMHRFNERVQYLEAWAQRSDCLRLAHIPISRLSNLLDLVNVSLGGMPSPPVNAAVPTSTQVAAGNNDVHPNSSTDEASPIARIAGILQGAIAAELQTRQNKKRVRGVPSRRYASMTCPPNYCSFTFDGPNAHRGYVYDVTEADGYIYSGSRDTDIRIWSLYSKQCVATIPTGNRVWSLLAVNKDDNVAGLTEGIVSGSWDNVIRIWSKYPDFKCVRELRGHRNWVLDLVVINGNLVSASADNTIKVWDVETGKVTRTLQGHSDHVYALVAHGNFLVSGSADHTIRLWNTETWRLEGILKGHSGTVRSLLSVDDDQLWSGGADNRICVWDTKSKVMIHSIPAHTDWVESMVLFDGDYVVSASRDELIKFWNIATRECTHTLQGHRNWVYSLVLAQGNKTLVSGSADSTIKVWDYKPM